MEDVIKKINRTRIRFILFFIVFGIASALLCMGLNLLYIAKKNERALQDKYKVIAVLQSNSNDLTKSRTEYESIKKLPYITVYEPSQITASSEDIVLYDDNIKYGMNYSVSYDTETNQVLMKNEQMIITFTYQEDDLIQIEDCLYGMQECIGKRLHVENLSSNTADFQKGVKYIAYGKIGPSMVTSFTEDILQINQDSYFQIYDYDPSYYIDNGKRFIENFYGVYIQESIEHSLPRYNVEPYEGRSDYWDNMIEAMKLSIYPVTVMSVKDVESIYDFHQEIAWKMAGDFFSASDYEEGAFKCLIDYNTAQSSDLRVGDQINLHFYISSEVMGDWGIYPTYYAPSYPDFWGNLLGNAEFEIIGVFDPSPASLIYNNKDNSCTLRRQMILIPDKAMLKAVGKDWMDKFNISGYMDQIKYSYIEIDPEHTIDFIEEMIQLNEITAAVYDGGRYHIERKIDLYHNGAIMLLIAAGAIGLLAAAGFAYSTYRLRREDARLMYLLGDGKARIFAKQLLMAFIISIPASLLGGFTAYLLSPKIIDKIQQMELKINLLSYLLKGNIQDYEFNLNINPYMILFSVAILSILVLSSAVIGAVGLNMRLKKFSPHENPFVYK